MFGRAFAIAVVVAGIAYLALFLMEKQDRAVAGRHGAQMGLAIGIGVVVAVAIVVMERL